MEITLRRDGSRVLARLGDAPEQPVDLVRTSTYGAVLRVGDRSFPLLLRRTESGAAVALGGRVFAPSVEDTHLARLRARASRASQSAQRHEDLHAPMSGLVVRVLCSVGDTVQPGQALVVLQAMKMENELSLPRAGTVRSVHVAPAQTVEQGQVLVELE